MTEAEDDSRGYNENDTGYGLSPEEIAKLQQKKTMTEAERIPDFMDFCQGRIQVLKAENERLQQLIKQKDEQLDYLHLKLGFSENTNKKFSEAYNEKENELKSAQELNRELVACVKAIEECYRYKQMPLNHYEWSIVEKVLNKAK